MNHVSQSVGVDALLQQKRGELLSRGLMSYPRDDEADTLRIQGIAQMLSCCQEPVLMRLPRSEILVKFHPGLPPELAYYLVVGDYEAHDLDFAKKYIMEGDRVMEVGCGLGVTGAALGKASGCPVVLVEPNHEMWGPIEENMALNGVACTLVRAAAVDDKTWAACRGHVQFTVSPSYWWSSTLPGTPGKTIQVPARRLGDLLEEHRPDVLAMDVEGAEASLLKDPLHPCVRRILVELHTPVIGTPGTAAIVSGLQRQGFTLSDLGAYTWVFQRERVSS